MKEVRRLDLYWDGDEVKCYDALKVIAEQYQLELPDFTKKILVDRTKK